MKKKKIVMLTVIASLCLVIAVGFFVTNKKQEPIPTIKVPANIMTYSNECDMEADAELIVIGSVETDFEDDQALFTYDDYGQWRSFRTYSSLRVDKVLKGEFEKSHLIISQLAAIYENELDNKVKLAIDEYQVLEKENTYILYLEKAYEPFIREHNLDPDTYGILGVYHGVINLNEDLSPSEPDSSYYERVQTLKAGALERFGAEAEAVTGLDLVRDTE